MNETERDHEVDAAWDAASREEPPPALDASIRAEARRAIGTAPAGTRHRHWLYPLAAAASVAALAIGIAQLTPPEQVAPTIVAEQGVASPQTASRTAHQSAADDTRFVASPPAAPAATASAEPPATPPPPALSRKAPAYPASAANGEVPRERSGAAPAPPSLAKKELQANEEAAARNKVAVAPVERPAPAVAGEAVGIEERTPAAVAPGEPFPAGVARRDATSDANAPARVAAAQAARAVGAPPPAQPAAGAARAESQIEAKVSSIDEARSNAAAGRSVEDWIRRIRELKSADRFEDAAKELAAFRTAFGARADALLPPDLRAMEPQPPK